MANLASKQYDTEQARFKNRPICRLQTTKSYQGDLFCTEVQENDVTCLQVQLLLS